MRSRAEHGNEVKEKGQRGVIRQAKQILSTGTHLMTLHWLNQFLHPSDAFLSPDCGEVGDVYSFSLFSVLVWKEHISIMFSDRSYA